MSFLILANENSLIDTTTKWTVGRTGSVSHSSLCLQHLGNVYLPEFYSKYSVKVRILVSSRPPVSKFIIADIIWEVVNSQQPISQIFQLKSLPSCLGHV